MPDGNDKSTPERKGMIPDKDVLTAAEVANIIDVELITVQRMAKRGDIPARKVGRQWRFLTEEIVNWLRGEEIDPQ